MVRANGPRSKMGRWDSFDTMSLPNIGPHPLRPHLWAQRVSRSAPHGLDVLEAHVLAYTTEADEASRTPWWRIAWGVSPFLALLASIGGFAAVFGSPRDIRIGRTDAPDAADIPWAMVSYSVAAIGVVLIFVYWIVTSKRHRNGALQITLVLTFAFGVFGVFITHQLARDAGTRPELMPMVPVYVMVVLAVIVFVIIQCSPPMPPEPDIPPMPVDQLGPKAMKILMRERNDAIKTLAERRLLPGVDVDELQARPLGRLHISDDTA